MSDWLASADYDSWRTSDVDREAMGDWLDWLRDEDPEDEAGDFSEDADFTAITDEARAMWSFAPAEDDSPLPW